MIDNKSIFLEPNDWDYLYEGNQHLILRYIGEKTDFLGKVLRLRKIAKKVKKLEENKSSWNETLLDEEMMLKTINEKIFECHDVIGIYSKRVETRLS